MKNTARELPIFIDGIKTNYTVNTEGEVFSLDYNHTKKKEKLKQRLNHRGYHMVLLHVDGVVHMKSVHRLVAETFLPNPKNLPQVNHMDGDKDNNNLSNLEWVSEKGNIKHAIDNGLITNIGENAFMAKITEKTARKICKCLEENRLTPKEIAKKCNVTLDIVRDIKRKKTWKAISKDYDISNYNKKDKKGASGEKNNFSVIGIDTVKEICKMIEENKFSLSEIAVLTGTTYKTVQHIFNRTTWRSISEKYDFSKYTRRKPNTKILIPLDTIVFNSKTKKEWRDKYDH